MSTTYANIVMSDNASLNHIIEQILQTILLPIFLPANTNKVGELSQACSQTHIGLQDILKNSINSAYANILYKSSIKI